MLLSLSWLRELTPYQGTAQELADRLTMLGLEIEEIKNPFEAIMGVVVGRVVTREAHPDSDHLSCCTVDVGGPEPCPSSAARPMSPPASSCPWPLWACPSPAGSPSKRARFAARPPRA